MEESRTLYTNHEGTPILRDSWVVYLDRLGTSEKMATLDDDQLRADLELFDRLRWFLADDTWNEHNMILSFSDNIVVGEPIVADDEILQAGMLIENVASYQLNLAARGSFIRGGIARGPLYMDARYVTGKGLITAYTLESKHADVPRVILSDEIAALIVEDCTRPPFARRWSWTLSSSIKTGVCSSTTFLLLPMTRYRGISRADFTFTDKQWRTGYGCSPIAGSMNGLRPTTTMSVTACSQTCPGSESPIQT